MILFKFEISLNLIKGHESLMKLVVKMVDQVLAKELVIFFVDINLIFIFNGSPDGLVDVLLLLYGLLVPNCVVCKDYLALDFFFLLDKILDALEGDGLLCLWTFDQDCEVVELTTLMVSLEVHSLHRERLSLVVVLLYVNENFFLEQSIKDHIFPLIST